jgi:hypothetical protein
MKTSGDWDGPPKMAVDKSRFHSLTGLLGGKPPSPVKQLLRKAIEVVSDFGCSHSIVQSLAHQPQQIVKIIR